MRNCKYDIERVIPDVWKHLRCRMVPPANAEKSNARIQFFITSFYINRYFYYYYYV